MAAGARFAACIIGFCPLFPFLFSFLVAKKHSQNAGLVALLVHSKGGHGAARAEFYDLGRASHGDPTIELHEVQERMP